MMKSLTINIPEEKLQQLQAIAQEKGMSTEELIQIKINEWLISKPKSFSEAAHYVLNKNTELYDRLA
ncbi:MAG: DNA-binding protein [Halothece sp. Uz-M2-17]|nr:DNA-binding protein [Halothece sp. Uz-M2-17]